ncbi:hypothetical protein KM043_010943 [Ampulex compressa]|nr:hypothetical protein KM043_010943 [Ampulex compressa]
MQTGGLWKELQTAHSGVPTTIRVPRTGLSTPSSLRQPPPSPLPACSGIAFPPGRGLRRYLYIGCPNFTTDVPAARPTAALSLRVFSLNQTKTE